VGVAAVTGCGRIGAQICQTKGATSPPTSRTTRFSTRPNTLDGAPGDDPLGGGVVTPDRWSAAIRFGTTSAEQQTGESLDQALAQEEADVSLDIDDERDEDVGPDENVR
jgi:hypothetical protein